MRRRAMPTSRELVEKVFSLLGSSSWNMDSRALAAMEKHRDEVLPRLLAAAADPGTHRVDRRGAALFLLALRDPRFREPLVACLADPDAAFRWSVVEQLETRLTFLPCGREEKRALFDHPATDAAFLHLLDDPDPRIRRSAVERCLDLGIRGATKRVIAMLDEDDLATRAFVAFQLSREGHPEALETLRVLVRRDDLGWSLHHVVVGLLNFLEGSDPELSTRAEEALRHHWEHRAVEPSEDSKTLRFVKASSRESTAALRKIFRESRVLRVRGACLTALVRHGETAASLELDRHLADEFLGPYAVEAEAALHEGTGSSAAARSVIEAARKCPEDLIRSVVKALFRIGGDAGRDAARAFVEMRAPQRKLDLLGPFEGKGLEWAIGRAVACGVLEREPAPEVVKAAREHWGEDASPNTLLIQVLALEGVVCAFDVESDELPCRHDELVQRFAAASRGKFSPTDVLQVWNRRHEEDDEADYTVKFTFAGRNQEFRAENHGDHYDATSVVKAVNASLEDAGLPERFVGMLEVYVFGKPAQVEKLAKEIGVPLAPGPEWEAAHE